MVPTRKALEFCHGDQDSAPNASSGDLLVCDEIVDGAITDRKS
jgi:hypothetical protein